jgi:ADP-L-glycero-D-manno-heptose 6-epimerase
MYLVTGGAGFIGSNLTAALSARGGEVMVVDRLRKGMPGQEKWRNLAKHTIAGIIPPEALEEFLDRGRPIEAVFHMGAVSDTTVTDGDLVSASNITLPLMLWSWCARKGVPFIYASSAAVYGDGALGFDDDASPAALSALRPLNLYGWSKIAFDRRVAQMLVLGMPAPPQWAGLRFFNVYGPNEYHKGRMQSVIAHKYAEIAAGKAATLFASDRDGITDGGQQRDFVHVDDLVRICLWLADHPRVSGLFNVGSGVARGFADLATAIYAALGRTPDIRYIPMPEDLRGKYQYFTEAKLDRLRAAGYDAATIPLEEGVAHYVRNHLASGDPHR